MLRMRIFGKGSMLWKADMGKEISNIEIECRRVESLCSVYYNLANLFVGNVERTAEI